MRVKIISLMTLLLAIIVGCAEDSNKTTGSSLDGSLGNKGSVVNIKEYFTAGSPTTTPANTKIFYKESKYNNRNDFEDNDDIDGIRLYFRYADNSTSEAIYRLGGRDYHAIVDDMVYAGHNWIGLELETLYETNGKPNYSTSRKDRISLVNIKTGEIIVIEDNAFKNCQDLESLEVLGSNKAYFLCENGAYSLELTTKSVALIGNNKHDKFDDSYAIIFANGEGVYQNENSRPGDIRLITNDRQVTGDINELPKKYFKNSHDDILYFDTNNTLNHLTLNNNQLLAIKKELKQTVPTTALGPVRNEDDATAKFMTKQVMLDSDAFYTYDTKNNTITKTSWTNTDYEQLKPFITNSEDSEEHIFFGENGIAYVLGTEIKYIAYKTNATPKKVTIPTENNKIDDITLIGDMLYFQLEDNQDRETYYRADVSKDNIIAEKYTGNKSIMKVIDIDTAVISPK